METGDNLFALLHVDVEDFGQVSVEGEHEEVPHGA